MILFSKNKIFLILIIFVFGTPKIVNAQLQINSFNSKSNPDWVEVKNNSDSEVNFSEYLIIDVAGNKIQEDFLIPAGGNCVFDFFNRLNNSGDTIFLQKNNQQIDCVKYGDGAGGQCDRNSDPISEKPSQNCFTKTPEPESTIDQAPPDTPKPTPPPPTHAPTPQATQKPTTKPTQTSTPTSKPSSKVLSIKSKSSPTPNVEIIEDDNSTPLNNLFSNSLIFTGSIISAGSLARIGFKEYTRKQNEDSSFH